MKKVNLNKLRMYKSTRLVLKNYASVWDGIPVFKSNFILFDELVEIIDESDDSDINSKGNTKEKEQLLSIMLDSAEVVIGGVLVYAEINSKTKLKQDFNFTKTSLKKGKDKEIHERCEKLAKMAVALKTELAACNITEAQLKLFTESVDAYQKALNSPKDSIKKSKSSKEKIQKSYDECDRILTNIIDNLMLTLKAANPAFYLEYSNARVIGGWSKKDDKNGNGGDANATE